MYFIICPHGALCVLQSIRPWRPSEPKPLLDQQKIVIGNMHAQFEINGEWPTTTGTLNGIERKKKRKRKKEREKTSCVLCRLYTVTNFDIGDRILHFVCNFSHCIRLLIRLLLSKANKQTHEHEAKDTIVLIGNNWNRRERKKRQQKQKRQQQQLTKGYRREQRGDIRQLQQLQQFNKKRAPTKRGTQYKWKTTKLDNKIDSSGRRPTTATHTHTHALVTVHGSLSSILFVRCALYAYKWHKITRIKVKTNAKVAVIVLLVVPRATRVHTTCTFIMGALFVLVVFCSVVSILFSCFNSPHFTSFAYFSVYTFYAAATLALMRSRWFSG